MSEVCGNVTCPNCGNYDECYRETDTKAGTEFTGCGKCGYYVEKNHRGEVIEKRQGLRPGGQTGSNPEGQETVMVTQAQIRRALGTVPSSRGVKYGNCKVSHITGGMYRITGGTARERMACKVAIESA